MVCSVAELILVHSNRRSLSLYHASGLPLLHGYDVGTCVKNENKTMFLLCISQKIRTKLLSSVRLPRTYLCLEDQIIHD